MKRVPDGIHPKTWEPMWRMEYEVDDKFRLKKELKHAKRNEWNERYDEITIPTDVILTVCNVHSWHIATYYMGRKILFYKFDCEYVRTQYELDL